MPNKFVKRELDSARRMYRKFIFLKQILIRIIFFLVAIASICWWIPDSVQLLIKYNGLLEKFLFALAIFITSLPVIVTIEDIRHIYFIKLLNSNKDRIEQGFSHDHQVIYLDTKLSQYQAVISMGFVMFEISSSYYLKTSKFSILPKLFYTLISILFGWPYFGTDGLIASIMAAAKNLASDNETAISEILENNPLITYSFPGLSFDNK